MAFASERRPSDKGIGSENLEAAALFVSFRFHGFKVDILSLPGKIGFIIQEMC
jgi:hypothetical protein